nr:2,3,4,5-tetrahydropyridine-2,6-dicarboxylate N-succinyltransferase [Acidobacteriota bacterium]
MPRDPAELARAIEAAAADPDGQPPDALRQLVEDLKAGLNDGSIRAAEKEGESWVPRPWVKKGILLGFRVGVIREAATGSGFPFFDKDTFPVQDLSVGSGVRIVPGGTAVRDGCYVGRGVTIMPPSYVNVGAWVGEGTLIDSHVLIGSCAQIGRRVHVSAGAQIGGVLEPVGE